MTLPPPDHFGNYYLTSRRIRGPAIFPYKMMTLGKVVPTGAYTAWRGFVSGFITNDFGTRIYYQTPEAALAALGGEP